jgi:hypothetical protein
MKITFDKKADALAIGCGNLLIFVKLCPTRALMRGILSMMRGGLALTETKN